MGDNMTREEGECIHGHLPGYDDPICLQCRDASVKIETFREAANMLDPDYHIWGSVDEARGHLIREAHRIEKLTEEMKGDNMETTTVHNLKCWPQYFKAIKEGRKTFDVRKRNDRTYGVGDMVKFRAWDRYNPGDGYMMREPIAVMITYVMHGGPWLPDDTWILGFHPVTDR